MARACSPAPIMARRCRSGRRCSWRAALSGVLVGLIGYAGRVTLERRMAFRAMNARRLADLVPPILFGVAVLAVWEAVVRIGGVPKVILPAPSAIALRLRLVAADPLARFPANHQRRARGLCHRHAVSGLLVAILIDRSPFLQRGLLPLGNFVSALPIVGVAPIMVMWFGFDWQSKAAVVVVMTFFPMLVNTVAGLESVGSMERDLMKTYAADYWQTLADAASPGRASLRVQRAEDQHDACHDRGDRRRILRHADRRHGLSHLDRSRAAEHRHGVGDDRRCGARGIGRSMRWSRASSGARPSGIRPFGRSSHELIAGPVGAAARWG